MQENSENAVKRRENKFWEYANHPRKLSDSEIKFFTLNSESNRSAAFQAGVTEKTWRKWASLVLYDIENNISCYEHLKQVRKNKPVTAEQEQKRQRWRELYYKRKARIAAGLSPYETKRVTIHDVLAGKHPKYRPKKVRQMVLKHPEIIPTECSHCGFKERRIDGRIPLLLDHINYNWRDHRRENIRLLCYNCYYLIRGLKPYKALKFGRISLFKFSNKMIEALEDEQKMIDFAMHYEMKQDENGKNYWITKPGVPKQKYESKKWQARKKENVLTDDLIDTIRKEAVELISKEKKTLRINTYNPEETF